MYSDIIDRRDMFLLTEDLRDTIHFIDNVITKIRNGQASKVGIDNAKKILKEVTYYSQPLKQVFGEQSYRNIIRTIASATNIKNEMRRSVTEDAEADKDEKSNNVLNSISNEKSIYDVSADVGEVVRHILSSKEFTFLEKVKATVFAIGLKLSVIMQKGAVKLSNQTETDKDKSGNITQKLVFKSSLEKFIDKFFDKLDENNIIKKNRKIVTNIMFLVTIALGLAIINIGAKIAGEDLNNVKSFRDFLRILKVSMTKSASSFIIVIVGLIIFLYSLYVILRKSVLFLLNKMSTFLYNRSLNSFGKLLVGKFAKALNAD